MDRAKYDSSNRAIKLFLLIGNRLLRDTLLRLCKKPVDISVAGYGAPSLVTSSEITASQCDIVLCLLSILISTNMPKLFQPNCCWLA